MNLKPRTPNKLQTGNSHPKTISAKLLIIITIVGFYIFTQNIINLNADTIPKSAEPGKLEERFKKPLQPKASLEPIIPPLKAPMPPEQSDKIVFTLTQIAVKGSSVYSEDDFLELYKQYLNKEISLTTVYEISEAITARYRNNGYILCQAIVPPQKIQNGQVHIQIIEGYISSVTIKTDIKDSRRLLKQYSDKITKEKPLQIKSLERYLLLAGDLPGVFVKSVIKPGKTGPGASELILVVDQKLFDTSAGLDNRGSKYIGPEQLTATLGLNSLFNLHESNKLRYIQYLRH